MNEHRVYGPPGTGKTTYLARQARRAASTYGGGGVVIAALTRTAAAEIAGRDTQIPEQNVGTLHSHAFHALDNPKIMEVSGIAAWNEWVPTTSMRLSKKMSVRPDEASLEAVLFDTEGDELLNTMNIYRQRMIPMDKWPPKVQWFGRHWFQFMDERGFMDFTGLIEECLESIDVLSQAPQVFMIDEAQDMSTLEMSLARKWGDECEDFVVVGDPDQNLYEWRGSDPQAFNARAAKTSRVLEQSYRVPKMVRDRALEWIQQIPDREEINYQPRDADGAVEVGKFTYQNPVSLVDRVQDELRAGRTVMVLGACGYMMNPLIAELRSRGEPFHNPYRPAHGGWNPLRGAGRLLAFLRPDGRVWGPEARFWTWDDLRMWTEPMQARGYITRGTKDMIKMKCQKERFGDSEKDQTVPITALFTELFESEHTESIWEMDTKWWEDALRHSERQRQSFPLAVYRAQGANGLRERPRLIVGTIHSVKGGEADVVFVFPDLSSAGYWDGWREGGAAKSAVVRQFYVGMTRAREKLVLCEAESNMAVEW